ncbi:hypothetical protein NQ176_g5409 [Zarea fungicola]|uniref:Uncharacterized protein n=1 Tax=Zarea fungicola TaxID=93591 RepID=A0ACC1N8K6_9HYPO|nr:hypothetical protein NQ176_g5409 [Lecanicillium fungicola]
MDPHQRGLSPDGANGSPSLVSLFCEPESFLENSQTGDCRRPDAELYSHHEPFDVLTREPISNDLDTMQGTADYSEKWEENGYPHVKQDTEYTYCNLLPDSSNSSLVSCDYYNAPNSLYLPLDLDMEEPASGKRGVTKISMGKTESLFRLQQRSRARTKFTREEDRLIVNLRKKRETWKEIARKIPGRSPGALQVRYSTKLKFKSFDWEEGLNKIKYTSSPLK